jgi:hypothetical protein
MRIDLLTILPGIPAYKTVIAQGVNSVSKCEMSVSNLPDDFVGSNGFHSWKLYVTVSTTWVDKLLYPDLLSGERVGGMDRELPTGSTGGGFHFIPRVCIG